MKFLISLFLIFNLSGCGLIQYFNLKPEFPEQADKNLLEPCPDLKQIEGNQVAITDLLAKIVENYQLYHQCSIKNDGWVNWYKTQKSIYEGKK
jgi:hypothetical protein